MQNHNKSTRLAEIEKQLGFSFLIRGQKTPPIQELALQATLIDAKLNPRIESKHIELLFDISRPKSWNPALTELEKAYLTDKFKKEFPRKAFVSDNLMKTLPLSQGKQEEFEKNRNKLANFDWRKK
jgi:hypothetical protein